MLIYQSQKLKLIISVKFTKTLTVAWTIDEIDSFIQHCSDPHIFIVTGKINPIGDEATDPLGIYQHLKLQHSLPLVRHLFCL